MHGERERESKREREKKKKREKWEKRAKPHQFNFLLHVPHKSILSAGFCYP